MGEEEQEKLRKLLVDTINICTTEAEIEAIDQHCSLFHGKDAGEFIISKLKAYGCPIYNDKGEVIQYEINEELAMQNCPNRIDERT